MVKFGVKIATECLQWNSIIKIFTTFAPAMRAKNLLF